MDNAVSISHNNLQVSGSNIHFITCGDKNNPPLFLLHSFYLSGAVYDSFIADLSKRFFLVIPDFPGFGTSQKLKQINTSGNYAKVLEVIRKHLDLKKISLFGFSSGGVVALKYAILFPKEVYKLSVQGAPYYYRDYDIILRDKIILSLTVLFPHLPRLLKWLAKYQFVWMILRAFYKNLDRTMRSFGDTRFQEAIKSISPQAAYEWGQDIIKIDLRADLSKILCPVQIVIGRKDPYLSLASVYRMASLISDAEVTVVRNGDHELTIKDNQIVVDRLVDFLTYDFQV